MSIFNQNHKYSISVKFNPKKNGLGIVFIQVITERKRLLKSVGVNCLESNFIAEARDLKFISRKDQNHEYKNQQIRIAFNEIENSILEVIKQYGRINIELAKIAIDNKYAKRDTLKDYANEYIKNKPLKESTKKRYEIITSTVIEKWFVNTSILEVNQMWLQRCYKHLKDANYAGNTIWSIFKFIRSIVNFAIDTGTNMPYPFGNKRGLFKMPAYKNPDRHYLSDAQIELIKGYHTDKDVMKRNVSRWFVLQVYLGCRASDLNNFSMDKIKDGKYYITDVKTSNQHFIPLYKELTDAMENIQCPMYSYDVYNRTIKAIGADLNFNFTLTTHVARHTFAVRWITLGGREKTGMNFMGIKESKTFDIYKKLTDQSMVDEANKIFGK